MDRILKPSFKALMIHSGIFGGMVLAYAYTYIFISPNYRKPVLILSLIISLLYLFYILYGFTRRLVLYIQKEKNDLSFVQKYKKEELFRRVINASFGAFANLVLSLFYIIEACQFKNSFYSLLAIYFILALINRIYLLSLTYRRNPYVEARSLFVTGIFSLITSIAMSGIVFEVLYGDGIFTKQEYLIYLFAFYAFAKIISAISSLVKAKKERNYLLLSFALISFDLACLSMFSLQVSLMVAFSDMESMKMFSYSGFGFEFVMFILSLVAISASRKEMKRVKDGKID